VGLIHRNLKPANLLMSVRADGARLVKLSDFACPEPVERARMEATAEARAALSWVAPEQLAGDATTPQTDLWSLGAVLYLLLTGAMPIPGDRQEMLAPNAVLPLRTKRADAPAELERVLKRCLSAEPGNRYPSAAALAQALAPFARRSSQKAAMEATILVPNAPAPAPKVETSQTVIVDASPSSAVGPARAAAPRPAPSAASQANQATLLTTSTHDDLKAAFPASPRKAKMVAGVIAAVVAVLAIAVFLGTRGQEPEAPAPKPRHEEPRAPEPKVEAPAPTPPPAEPVAVAPAPAPAAPEPAKPEALVPPPPPPLDVKPAQPRPAVPEPTKPPARPNRAPPPPAGDILNSRH
jgi:serine/threonine-protein kinase